MLLVGLEVSGYADEALVVGSVLVWYALLVLVGGGDAAVVSAALVVLVWVAWCGRVILTIVALVSVSIVVSTVVSVSVVVGIVGSGRLSNRVRQVVYLCQRIRAGRGQRDRASCN